MKPFDNITKKNPFTILAILVILGCVISNRIMVSSLKKSGPTQMQTSAKSPAVEVESPGPVKDPIDNSSQEASSTGMTVQDPYGLPQTQEEWDHVTQKMFNEKQIKGVQTQEAFAGRNLSPVEYKQRLELLNQQIKELEKKVQSEPTTPDLNQRLQNLYMLKSTLTNLREEIVK